MEQLGIWRLSTRLRTLPFLGSFTSKAVHTTQIIKFVVFLKSLTLNLRSGLAVLEDQFNEKWAGDGRRRFLDSLEHHCR